MKVLNIVAAACLAQVVYLGVGQSGTGIVKTGRLRKNDSLYQKQGAENDSKSGLMFHFWVCLGFYLLQK